MYKYIPLLLILLASCTDDADLDCVPKSLHSSVIAYYSFEKGSIEDFSGMGNDLDSIVGGAVSTIDRFGNDNCAYKFDDRNTSHQYLVTHSSSFLNDLDAFSVSVWYQPLDNRRAGGKYESLVSRTHSGEWAVAVYDCRRALFSHDNFVWADPTIPSYSACDSVVATIESPWNHVVGIKDGDYYVIYQNGILMEEATGNSTSTNFTPAQDIGPLFLGRLFTGRIDDVMVFDKALTAEEVLALRDMEDCGC